MILILKDLEGGPVEGFMGGASLETFSGEAQLKKSPCIIEAHLLLSGALNSGGMVSPTTTATLKIFFVQMGVRTSFRGSSRRRSRCGRSPSWATRISSLLVCGQSVRDFASVLRQPLGSHHRFICSHFWTGTLLLLLNICQLVSPFYIQDTRCKKRQSLSESWPSV